MPGHGPRLSEKLAPLNGWRDIHSVNPPALGRGSFGWLLHTGSPVRSVNPPALGRGSFGWLLHTGSPVRSVDPPALGGS
jgi:hypothetical protein